MDLFFGTSSDVKFLQYEAIFSDYNINLQKISKFTDIMIEPQGGDQKNIVSHPLKQMARFAAKDELLPFMIEDTMLFIEPFSEDYKNLFGLPGADTKNWWKNLGIDGVLNMLQSFESRKAMFFCEIGIYFGGQKYEFFDARIYGDICNSPKVSQNSIVNFPKTNPKFFHQFFIPEGSSKTISEMSVEEFVLFDYRRKCVDKMIDRLAKVNWYEEQQLTLGL